MYYTLCADNSIYFKMYMSIVCIRYFFNKVIAAADTGTIVRKHLMVEKSYMRISV